MSGNSEQLPVVPACEVTSYQQIPFHDDDIDFRKDTRHPTIKVPVVLAERKIQIVLESDILLTPAATEIKRVTKNVFLDQVKLVPVKFKEIGDTGYFEVRKAKLYVSGYIRKNIEYSSSSCNGAIRDRIADVGFSGFTELTKDDFLVYPVIGISDSSKAQFLNDHNETVPRLDKYFFQNQVKYNEQPYGELLGANFYELDFSPVTVGPEASFSRLREKIVMDLYLKVLQVQQYKFEAKRVLPHFEEGTLG